MGGMLVGICEDVERRTEAGLEAQETGPECGGVRKGLQRAGVVGREEGKA